MNKGEISHSTRSKKRKTEIKDSDNFRRGKEIINSINECVLNVLIGNIPLSTCVKRRLKNHKVAFRRLADKRVRHSAKKRLLVQKGGFLLPLLSTVLPVLVSVIFRSQSI
jgi:hypothetical protein